MNTSKPRVAANSSFSGLASPKFTPHIARGSASRKAANASPSSETSSDDYFNNFSGRDRDLAPSADFALTAKPPSAFPARRAGPTPREGGVPGLAPVPRASPSPGSAAGMEEMEGLGTEQVEEGEEGGDEMEDVWYGDAYRLGAYYWLNMDTREDYPGFGRLNDWELIE